MTELPADTPAVVVVPALLSVATAARILDCSPQTVRRRIHAGELAAYMDHGGDFVIRADELRDYIDALERVEPRRPPRRRPRAEADEWDFLR